MGADSPRTHWLVWSLIAGFWVAVGILSSAQFYYTLLAEKVAVSWPQIFSVQAGQWFLWIPLSPLILQLGARFPFERQRGLIRLFIHLAASAVIAGLHVALHALLIVATRPYPWRQNYEYAEILGGQLRSIFDLDFLIYWGVLGLGIGLAYYRKYREGELRAVELQAQLAQAQLQALKMQLHPHFLFNTLNAIAALVRKHEDRAATDMLAGLSDLLRLALENVRTQQVSLQRELEFLERYLDIEKIRFADRLQVRLQIAPETLDAAVPNLILQPLVENAIRHGIAPRATAGTITIIAVRHGEKLLLQITDDGPGLPDGAALNNGVGLSNTIARLQRLYGAAQSFVLRNAPEGGAAASLEIPFVPASTMPNGKN